MCDCSRDKCCCDQIVYTFKDSKQSLAADYGKLKEALDEELVDISDIDQALERSLAVRFRLGMFDPPEAVPYSRISPGMIGTQDHIEAATEAARQSKPLVTLIDCMSMDTLFCYQSWRVKSSVACKCEREEKDHACKCVQVLKGYWISFHMLSKW